jgi:hypothetical protein
MIAPLLVVGLVALGIAVGVAAAAAISKLTASGKDADEHFSNCPVGSPATSCPAAASSSPCTAEHVKQNLAACDGGTHAWDNAKTAVGTEPTVQVKQTVAGFGAETSGSTITIKPTTDCCDATESLLFELHNVESQSRFKQIAADAAEGKLSREEYTRANERVEYEGLQRNREVFAKCKSKWGCGAGSKSFADPFAKNFDDHYNHTLSEAHKNHYRTFWDNNYKKIYDASQPL